MSDDDVVGEETIEPADEVTIIDLDDVAVVEVGADGDAEARRETAALASEGTVYKVLHLEAVNYDLTDSSPVVHFLESESPFRYLMVPMALSDAIALQHAHSDIEGRRPSTHELMTTILTRLQAEVISARIVRHDNGVFYSELDLMTPKGRMVFDCRTSDAVTLALRQSVPAPILCAASVLDALYA